MPRRTSPYRASTTPTVHPTKTPQNGDVLPAIDCAHCGKRHPLYVFNLCRDQPHFESVCLSHKAQRKFWRISYYGEEPDKGPAFVSYGALPDAKGKQAPPKGRLLPHTQGVAELNKRIQQKLNTGYKREASASAYTPYLRFDDLCAMKEGGEFEVAINSDTGSPGGDCGVYRLCVQSHLNAYETSVTWKGKPFVTFWKADDFSHADSRLRDELDTSYAYYGDHWTVVAHPHPQDPDHADSCWFVSPDAYDDKATARARRRRRYRRAVKGVVGTALATTGALGALKGVDAVNTVRRRWREAKARTRKARTGKVANGKSVRR